jgi:hypothetical protein
MAQGNHLCPSTASAGSRKAADSVSKKTGTKSKETWTKNVDRI